ncbi:MAG: cytidylyltransferase domain-containing protein [Colwellia sp.]
MSVNAILQARVSSTRLPGKVLKKIMNKTMLELEIERINSASQIDKLIVATSIERDDDPIESLCNALDVSCYRGSLDDVLTRFYEASVKYKCDHIVRLTGDCPLIEAAIIDEVIALHLQTGAHYTSNCCPPSLPDGLDVEVFTQGTLEKSWLNAKKPSEREHVTQYVHNNKSLFHIENYSYVNDLSRYRWTVDEPEDLKFVEEIFQALYLKKQHFTMNDILSLLNKEPSLAQINSQYHRNQGLDKSKGEDKEQCFD